MRARLIAIAGPMFSGKSDEILRRLAQSKHAVTAGANIVILAFKPSTDKLYGPYIATKRIDEDGKHVIIDKWPAPFIDGPEPIISAIGEAFADPETDQVVLALDECQFFGDWIFETIRHLLRDYAKKDLEIIVSGLDLDAERHPFGPMPDLLAMADDVLKLTSVCFLCGHKKASLTKRLDTNSRAQVQLGAADIYQARCRACHQLP